jgi:hypothetical protein
MTIFHTFVWIVRFSPRLALRPGAHCGSGRDDDLERLGQNAGGERL